MSARQEDLNGFIEIKGNPLSKVGVFPYLGRQISESLIPDKIYNVFRPEEELSSQQCLDSFRLLPFTNDHAMLGPSADGLMPAEEKGVHGTIGEDVYFEFPYLKANLKIFSESIARLIEDGKQELSIGYRCDYEPNSGIYNGNPYDFVQRNLRGNHVALVDEGRAGHDVKVLDHFKFTLDSGVLKMEENTSTVATTADEEQQGAMSLEAVTSKLKELSDAFEHIKAIVTKEKSDGEAPAETKDELPDDDDDDYSEDKKTSDKKSGMDINDIKKSVFAELEARQSLYERLKKTSIGSFSCDGKSLQDVAEYAVKELKIQCPKGHEQTAVNAYLLAAEKLPRAQAAASDSAIRRSSSVQEYINKGAE